MANLVGPIRTTRNVPTTDEWTLNSTLRGIQLQKNGRNVFFFDSFEKAWEYVKNNGTSGDHILIQVSGTLSPS